MAGVSCAVRSVARRSSAPNVLVPTQQKSMRVLDISHRRWSTAGIVSSGFREGDLSSLPMKVQPLTMGRSTLTLPINISRRRTVSSLSSGSECSFMGSFTPRSFTASWMLPKTPDEYFGQGQAHYGYYSSIPVTPEASFFPDTGCISFGDVNVQEVVELTTPATKAAEEPERRMEAVAPPAEALPANALPGVPGSEGDVILGYDAVNAAVAKENVTGASLFADSRLLDAFATSSLRRTPLRQALNSGARAFVPGETKQNFGILPQSQQKPWAAAAHPPLTSQAPQQVCAPRQTVMLRNLPQRYNREMLMEDLDARGFYASYDFLYCPVDFTTNLSLGYAFINFVSGADRVRFSHKFVGLKLSEESPKVCEVCDAKRQGRDTNVAFYRDSTVMATAEEHHPVLLQDGVRKPFPKPTQPLGPVRKIRRGA